MSEQHPDELLAAYADGELEAPARAEVESHLAGCGRCREELALARDALGALALIPDVDPPVGLSRAAVQEARRPSKLSRPVVWAGAGAAAALVAAALFFSTRPAEEATVPAQEAPQESSRASEPGAVPRPALIAAADVSGYPRYIRSREDYAPASVQRRARVLGDEAAVAMGEGFPGTAQAFYEQVDLAKLPAPAAKALRCATSGAPPERTVVPFVLEEARFEGIAAYLVSFLQGPAVGEPFDRVQILVVEREGCTVQHFAQQRL